MSGKIYKELYRHPWVVNTLFTCEKGQWYAIPTQESPAWAKRRIYAGDTALLSKVQISTTLYNELQIPLAGDN